MKNKTIPIAKPIIGKEEISEVITVLKSGQLTQGKWVEQLEDDFSKFINCKFAVATSNGTTALHLALLALGIKPGDEIITPSFTFIASTNSCLYVGAKPVFVDIDPKTFNINPDLIEEKITKKTKAIMLVHLFGLPANMDFILKIARKYKLLVIEDAAQAHGAKINKKFTGTMGDVAAFSFYPTKNMTTSEGGMITTNNKLLAKKLRLLRNHGMDKRYYHTSLGFNFRMTNIQAAIGIHQLKKLKDFNKKRSENALFLSKNLNDLDKIQTPFTPLGFTHAFHQYTILVRGKKGTREKLVEYLSQNGVSTMVYYPIPVHKQSFMKKMYSDIDLPITEKVASQVLSLPIHPSVNKSDLQKIVKSIRAFYKL